MLGPDVQGMGRALEFCPRVAEGADDVAVRAPANESGIFCRAACALCSPYAPDIRGSEPPNVLLEGMATALVSPTSSPKVGIIRTLSRIAEDAARLGSSSLRVCDAFYG